MATQPRRSMRCCRLVPFFVFRRPSCRRFFFFRPQAVFRVFDAGSHSTSDFLLGVLRWQTVPRACGYPANACARVVHFPSAVVAGTASAKLGGVVTTYNQSRDHGEQRLGSYLDTRSDPNIYVRYRARRRHRDPDSSAPRFHWQPRCPDDGYTHPSDCLPLFVRYLPLLPHL
jgi:hypothetical protein